MNIFKLLGEILVNNDGANKAIDETTDKAKDSGNKMQTSFEKIGKAVVGAVSTAAIYKFGKSCVETAAQIQATNAQFQQTFSTGGENITATAQSIIDRVGQSSGILSSRLTASGTKIYAFAKASGATTAEALSLMEGSLQAAADTAAYYDVSLESATETLQSFLKGNFANDAALGVSATEFTRNAKAVEMFGQKYAELSEIQKQQVLLQMVTDAQRLSGAMGQAAREADGWENIMGNLNAVFKQFQATIGKPVLNALIPIINAVANNFNVAVAVVGELVAVFGTAALMSIKVGESMTIGSIAVDLLTGKLTLAAAAQGALNAIMSINPVVALVTAIGALTVGLVAMGNAAKKAVADMAGMPETTAEAAAKVEELKQRIEELREIPLDEWTHDNAVEYDRLTQALEIAEGKYYELKAAEEAAAAHAADPAVKVQEGIAEYKTNLETILDTFIATYSQIYDSVADWFKPFETAKVTVKTSVAEMISAMQSQIEFNNKYAENLAKLGQYGLGSLATYFQSLGKEGSAYAAAIVAAVEEAGGASSEGGQAVIDSFNDMANGVAESQGKVAEELTLLSGEFESALGDIVQALANAVKDTDKSGEAFAAAQKTFNAYLEGVDDQTPGILGAVASLGQSISATLAANLIPVTIPIAMPSLPGIGSPGVGSSNGATPKTMLGWLDGSHAQGLDRVPFDGYIAELHKDEMIVPAVEAEVLRNSNGNGQVVNLLSEILNQLQQQQSISINSREFGRLVRGAT